MELLEINNFLQVTLECGTSYKVDVEFRMLFEHFDWYKGHFGYLQTKNNGKIKRFHRMISDCPKDLVVDHINRDVYDNRKNNLRNITQQQNTRNRVQTTGKYKGVSWSKNANKWRSTITVSGKSKHLGYFKEDIEAAKAYDVYVINELGGDGYINGV